MMIVNIAFLLLVLALMMFSFGWIWRDQYFKGRTNKEMPKLHAPPVLHVVKADC